MLRLPRIYPITNVELSGISHTGQVRSLVEAGCRFVQIREKSRSGREIFNAVTESVAIANEAGVHVIVNDRVDVAIAARAHGIHLGQDDLPPQEARRLLGDEAIIGYSTHSVEQAIDAVNLPIDYIAIGPIFATATKDRPDPIVGLENLRKVREAIGEFPLVAIGGINISNLRDVLTAGADSAAVIRGIFTQGKSAGDRFREFEQAANV